MSIGDTRIQISLGLHPDVSREDRYKHVVCQAVSDLYESRHTACSGRRPSENLCGYDQLLGSRTPGQCDVRRQCGVLHKRPCHIRHRREGESIEVSASSKLALPFHKCGSAAGENIRSDRAIEVTRLFNCAIIAESVREKRIGINEFHHATGLVVIPVTLPRG
jgi:hypothetical protein